MPWAILWRLTPNVTNHHLAELPTISIYNNPVSYLVFFITLEPMLPKSSTKYVKPHMQIGL